MRIGLDFGTTNTSAALYDGKELRLLPLDPTNGDSRVLRSALFLTRPTPDSQNLSQAFIGREAIDRFSSGNVGRVVQYERNYIGSIELELGDIGKVLMPMVVEIDVNTPGRLFQSLKSELREGTYVDSNVFGKRYTLESLLALMLHMIDERVTEILGERPTGWVIGRPVHYAEDSEADALAFKRMRRACAQAGLPDVSYMEEPVAAALSYISANAASNQNLMVFDFGGGTFDVTVMRTYANGSREFIATDGVPVGGDLLDKRIVMGKLLTHFGKGAVTGPERMPVPEYLFEQLAEWETIVDLSRPEHLSMIDQLVKTSDKPKELKALQSLVRQNYGLPLYESVEQAKVALSGASSAAVVLKRAAINLNARLSRLDFERLIGPDARKVEACIDRALRAAHLTPEDIDAVLRTGGSSRVPLFERMLREKFGPLKIKDIDAFTSVASGLAVAAWEDD